MSTQIKPYPVMRNSGIPWLGDVPEQWEVKRNKLFLREVKERSEDGSEELLTVSQYTGVTRRRDRSSGNDELLTNAASLVGYKRVAPGDLVVNIMLAWNGSLGQSPIEGIASPAYCVFRANSDVEPRFLHYLFRSPLFTGVFKTVSTGVVDSRLRLYPDVFFRLPSLLPPRAEQSAVVRYLDHADRRIRRCIRAKQKLIKLLEEQKQAIILRAVTRGLDPNVRVKPSGVEGFGDVPEHWEVLELRRLTKVGTSITYGIVQAGPDVEGGIPYIRTSDMRGRELPKSGYLRTSPQIDAAYRRSKVETGDLVVAIRATLGKGLLVPSYLEGANLTQGTARVSPGDRLLPRFLELAFNSHCCQEQIKLVAKGTTFLEITLGSLQRVLLPVPPLDEQRWIVEHVDRSYALDCAIDRSNREITLLREYRTRLFTDVVTGKLDVRKAVANLPDEAEERESHDEIESIADEDEIGDDMDVDADAAEVAA